jgi:hypothetical protein
MKQTKIMLNEKNHTIREKSIELITIFGSVFAPISKCSVDTETGIITVPVWVFHKAHLNPCQMVSGYIG